MILFKPQTNIGITHLHQSSSTLIVVRFHIVYYVLLDHSIDLSSFICFHLLILLLLINLKKGEKRRSMTMSNNIIDDTKKGRLSDHNEWQGGVIPLFTRYFKDIGFPLFERYLKDLGFGNGITHLNFIFLFFYFFIYNRLQIFFFLK